MLHVSVVLECVCVFIYVPQPLELKRSHLHSLKLTLFPLDQLRPDCLSIQPDGKAAFFFSFSIYTYFLSKVEGSPLHSPVILPAWLMGEVRLIV